MTAAAYGLHTAVTAAAAGRMLSAAVALLAASAAAPSEQQNLFMFHNVRHSAPARRPTTP